MGDKEKKQHKDRNEKKNKNKDGKKKDKRQKKHDTTCAERADRHELYEHSVQCAEAEIDFVDTTFTRLRGRHARLLREDFCGTANTACEWVRRRPDNRAAGVDLDGDVLAWGRARHVDNLDPAERERIALYQDDVLTCETDAADIVLAMNFSYWTFKTRSALREYFQTVRRGLAEGGVFFLDGYGGYDAFREVLESTEYDGFTYVWDQDAYNAVDGTYRCHIHFEFPDGSRLERAFRYEWRLWTLAEIREVLEEAGFDRVTTYFEGWDEELEEGSGEFTAATIVDADAGWLCYITAEK